MLSNHTVCLLNEISNILEKKTMKIGAKGAHIEYYFFFLRDFIFKKTLFEKLQYLKQEQEYYLGPIIMITQSNIIIILKHIKKVLFWYFKCLILHDCPEH